MKKFVLFFLILGLLINWAHTHAEAQVTITITGDAARTHTTSEGTLVASRTFNVTLEFSQAVSGFEESDVTITNMSFFNVVPQSGGAAYKLNIVAAQNATSLSISVPANAVTPANAAFSTQISIDNTKPTVTITKPSHIQKMEFMTTVTFSEDVTGFDDTATDVELTGSAADDVSVTAISAKDSSASVYEVTITPNTNGMKGDLTISVPAGAAMDLVGNANTASSMSAMVNYNPNAPTVTISDAPTTTQNGAFDITVTFNEAVTDFTASDITLVGVNASASTPALKSGSQTEYTVTITPTTDGTLTISIPAGRVEDAVDDDMNVASNKVSVEVDVQPPTVTIDAPDTRNDGDAFPITITFSEDVTGFLTSELTLTNATAASSWSTGTTATTYKVDITPTIKDNNDGTVTIQVPASVAQDGASNGNTASRTESVTVDRKRPEVDSIEVPDDPQAGDFEVTISFSEDVYDFEPEDLTVTGADPPSRWKSGSDGPMEYAGVIDTSDIGNGETGEVTISVGSNVAEDAAENGNFASTSSVDKTVTVDKKKPTPTITAVSDTQSDDFMITITFDEDVSDFEASDISLSKQSGNAAGTASGVSSGPKVYTATITPSGMGTLRISILAGAAEDEAGNTSKASAHVDVSVDTEGPTLTITAPNTDQNGAFDATFTFSEDVMGFTPSDVTVTNANKARDWKSGATDSTYTLTLTPTKDTGTVTIDVAANAAQDNGNNGNEAATRVTVNIDKVKPTVTIAAPDTPQNGPFDVTITFSEDVEDFERGDITVTNADKATRWKSTPTATTYTLTLTPTATGGQENTVTIDVDADVATDAATNGNKAATQASVEVDKKRPTVEISDLPSGEENDAFDLTITFSEDVTGFAKEDLTVTGEATATGVAAVGNSKKNYTATIKPNANKEGNVTVRVKANIVIDAAGNGNMVSAATSNIHIDTIAPTVSISGLPSGEENDPFTLTITFSEDVTGFAKGDLTVTGQATATGVAAKNNSKKNYTATIKPNANKEGNITVKVKANIVIDAAGNNNTASAATSNIRIDTIAPTPTITAPSTPQNGAFDVTIEFDEPVSTFVVGDVTVVGATKAGDWKSETARRYVLTLTPTTADGSTGTVTIDVNASVAIDNAANNNKAASQATVNIDKIKPTVAITAPATPQNGAFDVTFTFSEDVTDFARSDVTVTNATKANRWKSTPTATTYTLTLTPTANAGETNTVTIDVDADAAIDAARNGNKAATQASVAVDKERPTVSISGLPSGEENDPFDLTITFSEDVTGFAKEDLMVDGEATATAVAAVGDSKKNYTATITPNAAKEGDITVKVKANIVIDAAGNNNKASAATSNIHIDTIAPTVAISGLPSGEENDPFNLTITFSEDVTGFEKEDLTVTGEATATAVAAVGTSKKNYTATITPNAAKEDDITVKVNADTVIDAAGNDNTASAATPNIHIDTIVPTVTISGEPTIEKNVAYDLTVTFSEPVNGFAVPADLTLTGPATAALKSGAAGGAVYTVTITPTANSEDDVSVTVNANTIQDRATNANTAGSNTITVHIDTIVPTVSVSEFPDIEMNVPYDLTVTFSEPVNGFAVPEDLTLELTTESGATPIVAATLASGVDGDAVYTVTITPNPSGAEGDVTVTVNADAVKDLALNDNTASTETDVVHVDTIVPTVTVSGFPTIEKNVAYDLTVTFSEDVNGFAVPEDLTLVGPATAALKSGAAGGAVYTVTITPNATDEGDVTVTVNADTVQDFALNDNTASTETTSVHVDTIPPTVSMVVTPPVTIGQETGYPTEERNAPYTLTVTFSEAVNGFAVPADLTVTGPGTAALTTGADGAAEYTVTITPNPTAEGDVSVTVNADTIQDFATNANPAGSSAVTVHIDTIVPTVSVSEFPDIEMNVPYDLTVTFSEPVNGFAVPADLTLGLATESGATPIAAATLASGVDGDAVYTVTITPNPSGAEGDVAVTVNADAVQDFALNNNPAGSPETDVVHVDTIIPTVSVSGFPPATPEQNGAFPLTVTFSEPVNGFTVPDDLTLTGPVTAALTTGADGAAEYTVTITPNPTDEGDMTVTVNADTVQDFALNDNTASPETDVVHVDTIPPTVSMVVTPPVTIGQGTGYPTEERNAPYTLTVTFSEAVNGFAVPADLTVTGPGTAALTAGAAGDSEYTVTITPNPTDEGDVAVTVNANTIQDFATNANPAGSSAVTVHIDTTPPTFTIEGTPVLQRRNDYFDIRIVVDEPVNGFQVPADFVASELVTPSLRVGTDGDREYTVRITPNEDVQGELIIEVRDQVIQDFALNLNANAVATTQVVRIDTIAPTVEITDLPTGVKNEPFDVTIAFAETVNGFTTEDIALLGPATVQLTAGTDGDATYTARITPNANASGTLTLQIPAASVQDLAGNANLASVLTPPIAIDTNALAVELQDVPETVQLADFSLTIVFSNAVEGFVLGDIEITGDAVVASSTLLGTGTTYTLNITPDENTDGDVIITIPAGVAQDATGKVNAASVPQAVAVAPSWMPDAALRDAIRQHLGLDTGEDFTQQQLRTLTTLEAEMLGMTDITGIEQVRELTTLDLSSNTITDITALQRLTALTTLNLSGNTITDITSLSGLTALTTLNLNGNRLTDIAALEDLTALTTLDLSGNAITDISLLANFTALTSLNLADNRIVDISPLTGLTNLTTLNLNNNPIGNFTPLTSLTALTILELGGTGLASLNAISGLTALTTLNIGDNELTDIALLSNLTALTLLNLSENTISTLTALSGLTRLTTLDLNDNAIIDITPLSNLTRLTTLALADNAITTFAPLTALASLTQLDLRENGITDAAPIVELANLQTLLLTGNPILNTAPLYPLTQRMPPIDIDIAVDPYPPWDVNADGTVDALDSALVTAALGQTGDAIENARTDVNGDGTVDNADLTLVTANFEGGVGGAPAMESLLSQLDTETLGTLDRATLETYLNQLRLESDGSLKYRDAIALLEGLLAALRPTETRLLANYPNPFNPETWLPYELAVDTTVEIFIYTARGVLVRHLELGHQPAGYYVVKSRAAYWDGRNRVGERVSSGVYFYELRAGDVSRLRKMLILK